MAKHSPGDAKFVVRRSRVALVRSLRRCPPLPVAAVVELAELRALARLRLPDSEMMMAGRDLARGETDEVWW